MLLENVKATTKIAVKLYLEIRLHFSLYFKTPHVVYENALNLILTCSHILG
jgi:hypothetical protein